MRGVRGLLATAVVVAGATFARGLGPWLESDDFGILALARIGEGGGGPASWLAFGPGRTWGYRPVVLALAGTFLSVFGTNGLAYHMASLATHLAAGLVLLALLHRRLGPGGSGIALLGPVLFFLVHPTADESVYWFSAIVYPLAALCGLGALWFFVRGLEATPVGRRVGFLGASAAAYGLALLSHPLAVAFAPALLLVPPARGVLPRRWERMALALPHLAAAAGLLLLTVRLGSPNAFGNVEADAGDAVRAGLELVGSTLALRPDAPAALAGLEALGVVAMVTLLAGALVTRDAWSWIGVAVTATAALLTATAYPHTYPGRYHYLPALGFALWLASLWVPGAASSSRRAARGLAAIFMAATIASGVGRNVRRATTWNDAGRLADAVASSLLEDIRARPSAPLLLFGIPDNVEDAYVFRNGLPERLALAGVRANVENAPLSAVVDLPRLRNRAAYLWLGEPAGWVDVSLERRGERLHVSSPGDLPNAALTATRVALDLLPGAYCLDLFAAAPHRAAEPRVRISMDEATVADLLIGPSLARYAVPVTVARAPSDLAVVLVPREVGLGIAVPALVVRPLPEGGSCS